LILQSINIHGKQASANFIDAIDAIRSLHDLIFSSLAASGAALRTSGAPFLRTSRLRKWAMSFGFEDFSTDGGFGGVAVVKIP
jgi:hypothetical protein